MTRILIGAAVLVVAVLLHYALLRRRGHPRPLLGIVKRLHVHLGLGVLGWLIAGVFVVTALVHGFGAIPPRAHIAPPPPIAGFPASVSVEWGMPPVQDQGDSNACVAFAVDEALWAERRMRGEALPYAMPAPYYQYWYNTYGVNRGTSIDGEAQAAFQHGMIPWSWLPTFGPAPSQFDVDNAAGYGGTYRYLFSGTAGWAGLNAIEAQIAAGTPVVLLLNVNQGFYGAAGGQASTDNTGGFVGSHGVVAVAYGPQGIRIRNSWGNWADGGDIWLTPSAVENTVFAAVVVEPGAVTWPAAQPTATATPRPRPTVTSTPLPHRVPKPKPTATPRPKSHRKPVYYRVTHTTILRAGPRDWPRTRVMLWKGQRVRYNGRTTPHWLAICSTKCGYVWQHNVARMRKNLR